MHSVQIGLLNRIDDMDDASISDYIHNIQSEWAGWSDWSEIGGRWEDLLDEPEFKSTYWPNALDSKYKVKVDYENIDLVLAMLKKAMQWQEEEFNSYRKRMEELYLNTFDELAVKEFTELKDMTSYGSDYYLKDFDLALWCLKAMLNMVDGGGWNHDSKFFHIKFYLDTDSIESVSTDPKKVYELLSNPETQKQVLEELEDYYLVIMDFHH